MDPARPKLSLCLVGQCTSVQQAAQEPAQTSAVTVFL